MPSTDPKSPNHLYKQGSYWYWSVYHSGYGMAQGRAKTKKEAIVNAKLAIAGLVS